MGQFMQGMWVMGQMTVFTATALMLLLCWKILISVHLIKTRKVK
jgi:hypothetical protein